MLTCRLQKQGLLTRLLLQLKVIDRARGFARKADGEDGGTSSRLEQMLKVYCALLVLLQGEVAVMYSRWYRRHSQPRPTFVYLGQALEPKPVPKEHLTEEELAEAKEMTLRYNAHKFKQERDWQYEMTAKFKLKNAAIAALPDELRLAALVDDDEPFPLERLAWTHTPPIGGFPDKWVPPVKKSGSAD